MTRSPSPGIVIAALVSIALTGCSLQQGLAQQSPGGDRSRVSAPPINAATVDGGAFAWTSARGHPLVIDFWGSWCGPCRAEQRELNAISARFTGKSVVFLGVDMRDDNAAAAAYRHDYAVTYPSVADPDEQISAAYDVAAPPTVIVVDAHGVIVRRFLGTVSGLSTALNALR